MHTFIKFLGILALVVLSLCCCRSVRYLPSESVHDTIYRVNDIYHASTVHDSVYLKEYTKGDTVYLDRWRRTVIKDTIRTTDTLYVAKQDTIRIPVEVEKKKSWWGRNVESPLLNLIYLALVVLAVYGVVRLIQRYKTK